MTREELIKKWLDNELNTQELKAFKALEDYDDLVKLSDNVRLFKAPEFNSELELESLLQKIETKNHTKNTWLKPLVGVAAAVTIFFAVFYINSLQLTNINTLASEKTKVLLPDNSNATLNALTSITYNKNKWTNDREVNLEGEAFFKVAKGSKFDVKTKDGVVSVLGTEFNVKQRDNIFEVICYEGLVAVSHNNKFIKLKPGDSYLVIDGKVIAREKDSQPTPQWLANVSYFKSMPFKEVISEFERQYNVTIMANNIDKTSLFTGSFNHNNLPLALKSITLPLNLNYSLENNSTIILTRE